MFFVVVFSFTFRSLYTLCGVPLAVTATLGFILLASLRSEVHETTRNDEETIQDYKPDKSNCYLAIQSDGMGVIDIASEKPDAGPKWILNSHAHPFQAETSIIRCADLRNLRIIRDASHFFLCPSPFYHCTNSAVDSEVPCNCPS